MKKLLTILTTAALAAASLTPIASHAVRTETAVSADVHQSLGEEAIIIDKELWPRCFTTGWEAERYPYDRMYMYISEYGGVRLKCVHDRNSLIRYNITNSSDLDIINAVLATYNAQNGTSFFSSLYYGVPYPYIIEERGKDFSLEEARKVSKRLKDVGLNMELRYVTERTEYDNWYSDSLTAYEELGEAGEEKLRRYIAENGLDCEFMREKGVFYVVPQYDITPMEHYLLMLDISKGLGISPSWTSPAIASQEEGIVIDCFDYVDGDANEDCELTISDAVLIMQSLSNPDKYTLTAQGSFNADIAGNGDGITMSDALAVQEMLLGSR